MAIIFGFAGTFVIIRPGFEAIDLGTTLRLISTLIFGGMLTLMKEMTRKRLERHDHNLWQSVDDADVLSRRTALLGMAILERIGLARGHRRHRYNLSLDFRAGAQNRGRQT